MSKKVLVISSDVDSYEIARRMAKVTHFEFVFVNSLEQLQVQLSWSKSNFIAVHFDVATQPLDIDSTANLLVSYASHMPVMLYSMAQTDRYKCLSQLADISYQVVEQRAVNELAKSLNRLDLYAGFMGAEHDILEWVDVRDGNDELVFQSAIKASKNDLPVLIEGGVGTPKAEMAVATHKLSNRYRHTLKIVDAELYTAQELIDVIFGNDTSKGLLAEADRGTLFINNLNNFTTDIQNKISDFLDNGLVYSSTEKANIKRDVRLIISTDLDLISEIKTGTFQEAFYYRISVSPIIMNKFNTIADDMSVWIGEYVKTLKPKFYHPDVEIDYDALKVLGEFDWPGNHTQFFQVLAWIISQSKDRLISSNALPHFLNPSEISTSTGRAEHSLEPDMADLLSHTVDEETIVNSPHRVEPSQYLNLFDKYGDMRSIGEVEEELIRRAIAFYDGKMSFVAKQLGIGRSTLYRKLKEYDIDPERPLELVS